uniref:Uncharacterized protein n=1 Tax=Anguilla anguilla TaxID=7936 RepID=A0A0E9PAE7_ANGAN
MNNKYKVCISLFGGIYHSSKLLGFCNMIMNIEFSHFDYDPVRIAWESHKISNLPYVGLTGAINLI